MPPAPVESFSKKIGLIFCFYRAQEVLTNFANVIWTYGTVIRKAIKVDLKNGKVIQGMCFSICHKIGMLMIGFFKPITISSVQDLVDFPLVQVKRIEFFHWPNCFFLSNNHFEIILNSILYTDSGDFDNETSGTSSKLIVWYNNKAYHALPSYTNAIHNAMLRSMVDPSNISDYGISTYSHPMRFAMSTFDTSTL